MNTNNLKIIANNRRAYFDYTITDTFEAGLVLLGSEVKSLRQGKCSLAEGYIGRLNNHELELINVNISEYKFSNRFGHEEKRSRKLLLNKKEIFKIINAISVKGYTAVPIKMYFKNGLVKIEIGIAKGKNTVDKRNTIKERDWKREQQKVIKDYNIKV